MARVPMAPGVHTIEVATWRPAGTAMQEFAGEEGHWREA